MNWSLLFRPKAGRKQINGVSDKKDETINSSISDNVDFYSDR